MVKILICLALSPIATIGAIFSCASVYAAGVAIVQEIKRKRK